MERFHTILQWLRLEDERGSLSLTTAAFVVGCICVLRGVPVPLTALAAFASALALYHGNKASQVKAETQQAQLDAQTDMQKAQLEHDAAAVGAKSRIEEVAARVEEVAQKVRRATGDDSDKALSGVLTRR